MSKVHTIDFEFEHDYALIGIHSILEAHRMAYFLNGSLYTRLERFKDDLDFQSKNCSFPLYTFEDETAFISWSLISNKYVFVDHVNKQENNLFQEETKISYLIPEKKRVDYFIKVHGLKEETAIGRILQKINRIHKVITSYSIDPMELKSRDNLIF